MAKQEMRIAGQQYPFARLHVIGNELHVWHE
jgi:hypothetical protein